MAPVSKRFVRLLRIMWMKGARPFRFHAALRRLILPTATGETRFDASDAPRGGKWRIGLTPGRREPNQQVERRCPTTTL
jgi:hypothetical protein